jgi:hypothetical protein
MSLLNIIHLDDLINVILVKERVRPAMLFQPIHYKERTHHDVKSTTILEGIKETFPHLIHSGNYDTYQGVLISYENYDNQEIDLAEMGKILGYPCYKDYCSINEDKISYSIKINAIFESGISQEIIVNRSKDITKLKLFDNYAKQFEEVLRKEETIQLIGETIKKVEVEIQETIPVIYIINKLINNEKMDQNEKNEIENILYNIGFSESILINCFTTSFQIDNPIHKGILLGLLLNYKNDTLQPFYPLQYHPDKDEQVYEIIKKWEYSLMYILEHTKINIIN